MFTKMIFANDIRATDVYGERRGINVINRICIARQNNDRASLWETNAQGGDSWSFRKSDCVVLVEVVS